MAKDGFPPDGSYLAELIREKGYLVHGKEKICKDSDLQTLKEINDVLKERDEMRTRGEEPETYLWGVKIS